MFLNDVINSGAIQTLELSARFASHRQRFIAHNIANLDTPNFVQADASVSGFQRALARAIDEKRSRNDPGGALHWRESGELKRNEHGLLSVRPTTPASGVLFHDRNNRDLDQLMAQQAENVADFRLTTDLLRNQFELIRSAIGQRA